MDLIDTIIDIAKSYDKTDARRLIREMLEAGVEVRPAAPQMTDKAPGKALPITPIAINHIGKNGKAATIYTMDEPPPTQPNRFAPKTEADLIDKARKEMNDLSKQVVDRVMRPTQQDHNG